MASCRARIGSLQHVQIVEHEIDEIGSVTAVLCDNLREKEVDVDQLSHWSATTSTTAKI